MRLATTVALATLTLATGSLYAAAPVSLDFNAGKYTVKTSTVDGQTIRYRAFENIVYVKNPVDPQYQSMNIFVPEDYYAGKPVGGYTADTAPIFFPNGIGGYMPALPSSPDNNAPPGIPMMAGGPGAPAGAGPAGGPALGGPGKSGPNALFVALSKGYVVASPGSRGRTNQASDGTYTGKAPAAIVDLKAAVRYLRFNDKVIPGNAERIISNGTSAGGAMSALLSASGNNKDYEPYLKALGAADARDDVWAASVYCPITNLDNADMAYEWQFNGNNDYAGMSGKGTLNAAQIQASAELKALFPAYVNSLNLKKAGTALSLDSQGQGTFKEYLASFIAASAQKALDAGKDLSAVGALTIRSGKVTGVDFDQYIAFIGRMKATPAFDAFDASTPENSVFGTSTVNAQHFTAYGLKASSVKVPLADPALVKMMNPMNYIGDKGATTAKFWRIRHGASDRDASFPIAALLATKLQNNGVPADLAFPWGQGHGGDYDLDELFAWIAQVVK